MARNGLADGRFSWRDGDIQKVDVSELFKGEKGGPGSGHHGHAGRPGKRGGSAPGAIAPRSRLLDTIGYAPSSENISKARARGEEQANRINPIIEGDNPREYIEQTLEGWEEEPIAIRRGMSGATDVLRSGRFKTQFETGRSAGTFDPEMRTEAENRGMGVPEDIDVTKRPVYGYLDVPTRGMGAGSYGPIEFVLKPEVKQRTTVTVDDSLVNFMDVWAVGVPVDRLSESPEAWDGQGLLGGIYKEGRVAGYIEAQIHGGVSLGDIQSIRVHVPWYGTGMSAELIPGMNDLTRLAQDAGLDIEIVEA